MGQRLDLMLIEKKRFAAIIAENLRRFRQDDATSGEIVHGRDAGVGRADLKQRLRPKPRLVQ